MSSKTFYTHACTTLVSTDPISFLDIARLATESLNAFNSGHERVVVVVTFSPIVPGVVKEDILSLMSDEIQILILNLDSQMIPSGQTKKSATNHRLGFIMLIRNNA